MEVCKTMENKITHFSALSGRWSYLCLNGLALAFMSVFAIGAFVELPVATIATSLGYVVIAISLFLFTRGQLYRNVTRQMAPVAEVPVEAAARKPASRGLETIGRLAGGVAHDFNNSLMVLLNCIEIMRTAEDAMTRQALLGDMESAAKGAQSTAQQLMSLSQQGSTPGQPSDPRTALRSIASNLRRMLPETITVRDLLRGTPPVALVSGQFEQVILNLCLDARDAMAGGGELILRCYKDPVADEVLIEIEDDAEGRDPVPAQQVLDWIATAGGRVEYRETGIRGTCITLILPVVDKVEALNTSAEQAVTGNPRALLIDDNELVLAMLSTRLEEAGYDIVTATSVAEAEALVAAERFDVLVSDAILPDGNPAHIVEQYRAGSDGPVVICSGYPKTDPLLAELNTASAIFLQKPFSTDQLLCELNGASKAA